MKTQFVLIFIVISLSVSVHGQISKGRQMLGCSFNFSKSKNQAFDSSGTIPRFEEAITGRDIGIRYGYFITSKIMLGASASLNTNRSHIEYTSYSGDLYWGESNSNNFNSGVFVRYYNVLGKSKFAAFGQLSINYNKGQSISTSRSMYDKSERSSKNSGPSAFLSGGFTYFLNKNIAFETTLASIGFTNFKTTTFQDDIRSDEHTNFQLRSSSLFSFSSLYIGLNFYFGGKNKAAETTVTAP